MSSEANGSSEIAGYRAQVRCFLDKQQLIPLLPGWASSVLTEFTNLLGRQEECPESREMQEWRSPQSGQRLGVRGWAPSCSGSERAVPGWGGGAGVGWGGAEPGECSAFQAAISWLSVLEFVGNLRKRN